MDYDTTLDELNITLGDTADVTFSPEEKQRALDKAWKDPYVVKTVWDSSLNFSSSTFQYPLPSGVGTVKEIYISTTGATDEPQKIDSSLWEVVDGNIQFKNWANNSIPEGYVLYLKGNYKLDKDADTLDTPGLQEYVIASAGFNTLTLLGYKKANLFLKNDTSMAELIALRRELKQDVVEGRMRLSREFESV